MSIFKMASILAGLFVVSATAHAQAIDAFDRGWYSRDSFTTSVAHLDTNTNYLTGLNFPGSPPVATGYRSFFAFDLSSFSGQTFTSGSLHLFNPGGTTPGFFQFNPAANSGPFETLELRDVSTPVTTLLAGVSGGTSGQPIYDDLGTGLIFGTINVSAADNGSFVNVALNTYGLAALNAAAGGMFVVGGRLSSVDGGSAGTQVVFASTNPGIVTASSTQLIVEVAAPIPEPETYAMLLAGLGLLGFHARRRKLTEAAVA